MYLHYKLLQIIRINKYNKFIFNFKKITFFFTTFVFALQITTNNQNKKAYIIFQLIAIDSITPCQLLRRHLVHIFQYDFPEHYGEVLQTVLIGCSDQRLLPTVLAELLQAIYQLANCPEPPTCDVLQTALTAENPASAVGSDTSSGSGDGEYMTTFAVQQQLFGFKAVQDTLAMLAQHFRTERLQHGLHGLYPKHREYCAVLSVLLRSYGYALVVTAVYAYPGLLADKCEFLTSIRSATWYFCLVGTPSYALNCMHGSMQTQRDTYCWTVSSTSCHLISGRT